jgi:hypothetical protein
VDSKSSLNTQENCIIAWSGEQTVILELCGFTGLGLCTSGLHGEMVDEALRQSHSKKALCILQ